MPTQSIRCGIIGYGKMGRIRANAVAASHKGEVLAVYDTVPFAPCEFPALASADEIIHHPEIDAVFICTPNHQNYQLTKASLVAGKHVFCEKPPAFTAAQVEDIRSLEAQSALKVMYGFNHRHHDSVRQMKAIVESGKYGRLLWMRGRYGKSVDHNYFNTWRAKKELAGGGILLDQGIHMLDLFLHLAGDFDEVQGMISSLYWNLPGIEDNVFANLRNRRTGVVASLHSTMTQWRHLFSLEVFLQRGYMVLNGLKTQSGSYGEEILAIAKNRTLAPAATWEDEEKTTYHVDNSWIDETTCFLDAVLENKPITTGNTTDALRVMRLIDQLYTIERYSAPVLHESLSPEEASL